MDITSKPDYMVTDNSYIHRIKKGTNVHGYLMDTTSDNDNRIRFFHNYWFN